MITTTTLRSEPGRPRPRRPQIEAITVGPWHTPEFATALANFQEGQSLHQLASIEEACGLLSTAEVAPELILLAQPLPGTVRQQEVDRLQRLAPLARIVVVAGSWCEGELRTGSPPVGVLRLYWYELAPWWQAALRRLSAGLCPAWSAPLDHPQAGRYSVDATINELMTPSIVAIGADDFAVFECLADALAASGASATWARSDDPVEAAAGIWDGGQLSDRELERLGRFCRQVLGPVVALLDFPRVEHIIEARAAGAVAVFGKPYVVEEVLAALR
ncbi:MAG: hypothetical protein IH898_07220 [Planctomycetes bacterium]|nr:hypothetical protein [Planctomycetota bacterium]